MMRAHTSEVYFICCVIEIYQKEVALYMALHEALVSALKRVWEVLARYWCAVGEDFEEFAECCNFLGLVLISLDVLLELCGRYQSFHADRMSFIISSTSVYDFSPCIPQIHSSIAEIVSALGM